MQSKPDIYDGQNSASLRMDKLDWLSVRLRADGNGVVRLTSVYETLLPLLVGGARGEGVDSRHPPCP